MNILKRMRGKTRVAAAGLVLVLSSWTAAQEGHPLTGTWSGDRQSGDKQVRVLLILDLQRDQAITGTLIENGARIPLSKVTMNPDDWSVNMQANGKTRSGEIVSYQIEGVIEDVGSATERVIAGTWKDGNGEGKFSVRMN